MIFFSRIGRVGSGSDYAHFYHYGAIPVVDIMHGMNDIVSCILYSFCLDLLIVKNNVRVGKTEGNKRVSKNW